VRLLVASTLLACAATCEVAAQDSARPAAPDWTATLPFAPDAARVANGRLEIARIAGGAIELSSAPLSKDGVAAPAEGSDTAWAPTASHAAGGAPTMLAAGASHWYGWSEGAASLTVYAADFSAVVASPSPPFPRVDAVAEAWGSVVALGRGEQSFVAAVPLDGISPSSAWTKSAPMPQLREGAGLALVGTKAIVVGGEASGTALVSERTEDGAFAEWTTPLALRFAKDPGIVRVATCNGAIAAIARTHEATQPLRMHVTVARENGTYALWHTVALEAPPVDDAIIVADEENHKAIVLGGRASTGGSPMAAARAWELPITDAYMQRANRATAKAKAEKAPGEAANGGRPRLKAGMARAASEGKFLFVLAAPQGDFAGRYDPNTAFLNRENVKNMLEDVIVAQAWPEELEEVAKMTGKEGFPQVALLDAKGAVVSSFAGVPSDVQMFELLKGMWEPKLGEAPGQ